MARMRFSKPDGLVMRHSNEGLLNTVPIPWEAVAFWRCCIPCRRQPRFLLCFDRRGRSEQYDPWSVLWAAWGARSSGRPLWHSDVSTTGNSEAPLPCVFLSLYPLHPDLLQKVPYSRISDQFQTDTVNPFLDFRN
jgi:hypothetical protein